MGQASKQELAKIVPHLWYDTQAAEAAELYASVFPDSRVNEVTTIPADTPGLPEGSGHVVDFTVFGQPFVAISAGPYFRINPSISIMVNFDPLFFGAAGVREQAARDALDHAWNRLVDGGKVLMEIGEYPFSPRYGWVEDKYGLSWQLILTDAAGEPRPPIIPSLLFTQHNAGKAEEAIEFYLSVFREARLGSLHRYGPDQAPDREGTVMFADFVLENRWFAAMDSAHEHGFVFNEAVSLMVNCETQQEIDHYWEKLSAVPASEQCGWLKDRFGVSWQITPTVLDDMMKSPDRAAAKRAVEAMLKMKKLDIAALERAFGSARGSREKELQS